jgi:hypothetical protein
MARGSSAGIGDPRPAGAESSSLQVRLTEWEDRLYGTESDGAFLAAWTDICAEIRALASRADFWDVLDRPDGRDLHGRLAPFQRHYLSLAERGEAEALLAAADGGGEGFRTRLSTPFGRHTFDRLEDALSLIDMAFRQVVVVGCGPLPAAAVFFHERAPAATVTAVEIDSAAAGIATRVGDRYGSGRLEVVCQDGCCYDYRDADIVYVVNQVTPKHRVLDRIAETAPANTRVLLRDPFGPGRLLADAVDGSLPTPWRTAATGAGDENFFSRHLLLVQRQG